MARVRRTVLLVLVAAVAALGAGCGGGDAADHEFEDRTDVAELDIASPDNDFNPAFVEITEGTTVTWTNTGRNDHNVVPVNEGSFEGVDTDDFESGDTYEYTFDTVGEYPYYCSIHGTASLNGQAGIIRVVPS